MRTPNNPSASTFYMGMAFVCVVFRSNPYHHKPTIITTTCNKSTQIPNPKRRCQRSLNPNNDVVAALTPKTQQSHTSSTPNQRPPHRLKPDRPPPQRMRSF
ncbi:hypothetical protein FCV25MIE_01051 [Fagus crenata]